MDFLRPIMDDNREEIFLIQYEGYIKNMSEEIILKMKYDQDLWEKRFPLIKEYFSMSHLELYDATVFFSPVELLSIISNGEIDEAEVKRIYDAYLFYSVEDIRVSTSYSFALKSLFQKKFVKKSIFVSKTPMNRDDRFYLFDEIIRDKKDRCEIFKADNDDDLVTLVKDYHPTTIYIDSYELMNKMWDAMDETQQKRVLFIIRATPDTYHKDKELNKYVPIHDTEYFLKEGKHVVMTEIPSTGIDKTLSVQEPMG